MPTGRRVLAGVLLTAVAACTSVPSPTTTSSTSSTALTTATTVVSDLPTVNEVTLAGTVPTYQLVELTVDLEAVYDNPFDQRQVSLDAQFTGPDGASLVVPGFWDAQGSWKVRFTPDRPGDWTFETWVTDSRGTGWGMEGSFNVIDSDHRGFLRFGSDVDPSYSPRYFAYEDGTAWYGRGHADLDMSLGGAALDGGGLRKFSEMAASGENYEMWWPMWGSNFIQSSYDNYSSAQLSVIDFVIRDAEEKGVAIVFTVWTHQFLRTGAHDWSDGRWQLNGFRRLTDIDGFFTDEEAWAWQENLYRYMIARWSYSPAILMWQTITEINGTESYEHTDAWHAKVNAYFQDNDPFRHPTTATGSGGWDWPIGHAIMDVPQMHVYETFIEDPIHAGAEIAHWTRLMWDREVKPNWIGEYGHRLQRLYPEFMHHANWAALGAGAAMTPIEWNDGSGYGSFDQAMKDDMKRFADFVEEVPLVEYDPRSVELSFSHPGIRGWGVVGETGGVIWVQDAELEGRDIDDIRRGRLRSSVTLSVPGLTPGTWQVAPYNTWTGEWLERLTVTCGEEVCAIEIPDFSQDIALALSR